ncbi:ATP-grasp ribosomal peptide maturase [Streptomyces celluloflavus]|uniref:ATP-grasp ribosomal peptide maturase n=1 Tax=Streptomyces celluloflavus TaxID=58344 RepID=UPI0036DC8965
MPTVLVIAARDDWPTDRVVKTLDERGATVFRMDAAEFPEEAGLAARIDDSHGWAGGVVTSHRELDLADVSACYFRAPHPFRFPEGMSDAEQRFAAAQARAGFGGILTALDCRWVSHPSAMSRAEYKPYQLAAARECGLTIPSTLITNRADAVQAFAGEIPGPIICKPVASPVFIEGDQLKTVYTRVLAEDDLGDFTGIETTAHLFQAWVDKAYEVRLTMVGDRPFAAEVHSDTKAGYTDWRSDYKSLTYKPTTPPPDVIEKVRALMLRLELRFGALDFVVSPAGEWTFLEVNPCGQWDWIQHATGHPIAEGIADELLGVTE